MRGMGRLTLIFYPVILLDCFFFMFMLLDYFTFYLRSSFRGDFFFAEVVIEF